MLNPKQGEKQQNIKGIKIFPYKHHAYTFFALHFLKKKKKSSSKTKKRDWYQKNKKENRIRRHTHSHQDKHRTVEMHLGSAEGVSELPCDGSLETAALSSVIWVQDTTNN